MTKRVSSRAVFSCSSGPSPPHPQLPPVFSQNVVYWVQIHSAESFWQPKWMHTLQTIKVTTAMRRELVQALEQLLLDLRGNSPSSLAAHLWLPLTATFQPLHGSSLLQTMVHFRCPDSFLLYPRCCRQVSALLLSHWTEGQVYPLRELRL